MNSSTRYSPEVRDRAVRLVLEHQGGHDSQWSASSPVASKLGCTAETLRKWVRRADSRFRGNDVRPWGACGAHQRGTSPAPGAGAREPRAAPSERDSSQGAGVFRPGGVRPPREMMVSFIDAHRGRYGVGPVPAFAGMTCAEVPIAPSTYYEHKPREAEPARGPARVRRDGWRCGDIRRVHAEHFEVYGVRKVWRPLRREGGDALRGGAADAPDGVARSGTGPAGEDHALGGAGRAPR